MEPGAYVLNRSRFQPMQHIFTGWGVVGGGEGGDTSQIAVMKYNSDL